MTKTKHNHLRAVSALNAGAACLMGAPLLNIPFAVITGFVAGTVLLILGSANIRGTISYQHLGRRHYLTLLALLLLITCSVLTLFESTAINRARLILSLFGFTVSLVCLVYIFREN